MEIEPRIDRAAVERLHLNLLGTLAECAFAFALEPELVVAAPVPAGPGKPENLIPDAFESIRENNARVLQCDRITPRIRELIRGLRATGWSSA